MRAHRLLFLMIPAAVGCAADSTMGLGSEGEDGKADSATVNAKLEQLTQDGSLSPSDVDALFTAAGASVSKSEMLAIRDATESTAFTVSAAAKERALERAYYANLLGPEADELRAGTGYGGNEVPAKVRELVAKARLNGAAAFDVRETDSDGEGRWNPYPTTSPPIENMTFQHTLITPDGLAADKANTTVRYNQISGTKQVTDPQSGQMYEEVTYVQGTGGTGNITAQYDEAYHPDIFARGSSRQIWASNCGFLSDGTIHCLPAARRNAAQDLILTNPHLSRCNEDPDYADDCHTMMYLGHITASGGVITSVEISGRLSKEVARGRINGIDPIALFEAWGFQVSPSLRLSFGNTEDGIPVRDEARGVISGD